MEFLTNKWFWIGVAVVAVVLGMAYGDPADVGGLLHFSS